MTIVQSSLFDYMQLDAETRIVVQQRTEEIKTLMRSALGSMIEAGRKCGEVRDVLQHNKAGGFRAWIDKEGLGRQTVYSLISMHEAFGNCPNFGQLDIAKTAAYLLSAPSTPETARVEAIERAQVGETITHATAQQIVAEHKPATTIGHNEKFPDREELSVLVPSEPTVDTVKHVSYEEESDELAGDEDAYDWADDESEDSISEEFDTPDTVVERNDFISSEVVAKPHVANNSGDNEWYTPAHIIEAARSVMGGIDLDPASNDVANEVVRAATYYTVDDDGLSYQWAGRIWLNPPYARESIAQFIEHLVDNRNLGHVTQAIVLVNNATETIWFRHLISIASSVVFPGGRVRFWKADGETSGPLQGQAIVYIGDHPQLFYEQFAALGWGAIL